MALGIKGLIISAMKRNKENKVWFPTIVCSLLGQKGKKVAEGVTVHVTPRRCRMKLSRGWF